MICPKHPPIAKVHHSTSRSVVKISFIFLTGVSLLAPAQAATLFVDEFDGNALDTGLWRLPTGAGTFFGRTQIKPPEYDGQDLRPVVSGGTIKLQLDTYNASAITPGDSFWGHEIQTLQFFSPGDTGIAINSRIRFTASHGRRAGGWFFYLWSELSRPGRNRL